MSPETPFVVVGFALLVMGATASLIGRRLRRSQPPAWTIEDYLEDVVALRVGVKLMIVATTRGSATVRRVSRDWAGDRFGFEDLGLLVKGAGFPPETRVLAIASRDVAQLTHPRTLEAAP